MRREAQRSKFAIKETLQIQSAEPIERSEAPCVSEACVSCWSECCDNGNFEAAAPLTLAVKLRIKK